MYGKEFYIYIMRAYIFEHIKSKSEYTLFNPFRGGGLYYIPSNCNQDLYQKRLLKFYFYRFGGKEL